MQALKVLVVVMGVMIVAGTVTLAVLIVNRVGGTATSNSPTLTLDEPAGTHIVSMGTTADRIVLNLQGGGPDRVVWIDPKTGLVAGRAALAR